MLISSNFQEMFIKASFFLLSKYLIFDFYALKFPLSYPGPCISEFSNMQKRKEKILSPIIKERRENTRSH